jgi:hypothetical protein
MRICLLIPDGVGIRNYLYSDLLKFLHEKGHQVILWHSLDPEMIRITQERTGITLEQVPFVHRSSGGIIQLCREAGRYARLKLNAEKVQNPTILSNWTGAASSLKGRWLNIAAEFIGKMLNSYEAVARIETQGFNLMKKSREFSNAKETLKQINPDLLFCTHQRVFSVTPAIEAAKSLGIPTSTAIFSWDNLPKGRLPFRVDQYLVWSEHMKSELNLYYPEISSESIQVTGSPQFDFYFQKDLVMDRAAFGEKYGLDQNKSWVCFSGCDSLTSPQDPQYLRDVAESMKGYEDAIFLFRPVPVEPVDRFRAVLDDHPEVKLLEPKWVKGSHWGNFFPLFEDIQLLVNLAYHCKVVINMGSTMAHDFSTFGNVGLYLRYDHAVVKPGSSVSIIYQFQHFRSMGDWNAVGYIYSKDEILPKVKMALDQPDQIAPDRKKWFTKIVEPDSNISSAKRVAKAILSLVDKSN